MLESMTKMKKKRKKRSASNEVTAYKQELQATGTLAQDEEPAIQGGHSKLARW
jgi:hypothetical protein